MSKIIVYTIERAKNAEKESIRIRAEGIDIHGGEAALRVEKGYLKLRVQLNSENDNTMEVSIEFDIPARFVYANTNVRADAGKVAVVKGPIVYAMEEADNSSNLMSFAVDTEAGISETWDEDLFGGCMVLKVSGIRSENRDEVKDCLYGTKAPRETAVDMKLIPYAYWNNRGQGEMLVWMRRLLRQ